MASPYNHSSADLTVGAPCVGSPKLCLCNFYDIFTLTVHEILINADFPHMPVVDFVPFTAALMRGWGILNSAS